MAKVTKGGRWTKKPWPKPTKFDKDNKSAAGGPKSSEQNADKPTLLDLLNAAVAKTNALPDEKAAASALASGGTVQSQASSAGENAGGDAPLSLEFASVEEFQNGLKAKMSRVFARFAKVKELRAHEHDSKGALDRAVAHFSNTDWPAKADELSVRTYLEELEKRKRAELRGRYSIEKAALVAIDAEEEYRTACTDLRWQLGAIDRGSEVRCGGVAYNPRADEIVQIVRRLLGEAPSYPERSLPTVVSLVDAKLTVEQQAGLDALRQATFRHALITCRAHIEGPEIVKAAAHASSFKQPFIVEPVRPEEEEIQRYLSQVEDYMVKRRQAHSQFHKGEKDRAGLLKAMSVSKDELVAALAVVRNQHSELTGSAYIAVSVGDVVFNRGFRAEGECKHEYTLADIDGLDRERQTPKECRQIEKVRALMYRLAEQMGHLNLTNASLKVVSDTGEETVSEWLGISKAATWQDCLDLLALREKKCKEAACKNVTRKTKVELLEEAKVHYEAEKLAAAKALYRYVLYIKPSPLRPPCDLLRSLMNASAWMYHFHVANAEDSNRVRDGAYPMY